MSTVCNTQFPSFIMFITSLCRKILKLKKWEILNDIKHFIRLKSVRKTIQNITHLVGHQFWRSIHISIEWMEEKHLQFRHFAVRYPPCDETDARSMISIHFHRDVMFRFNFGFLISINFRFPYFCPFESCVVKYRNIASINRLRICWWNQYCFPNTSLCSERFNYRPRTENRNLIPYLAVLLTNISVLMRKEGKVPRNSWNSFKLFRTIFGRVIIVGGLKRIQRVKAMVKEHKKIPI